MLELMKLLHRHVAGQYKRGLSIILFLNAISSESIAFLIRFLFLCFRQRYLFYSGQGGVPFNITLTKELLDDTKHGDACFEGVATVRVRKLDPHTLSRVLPGKCK